MAGCTVIVVTPSPLELDEDREEVVRLEGPLGVTVLVTPVKTAETDLLVTVKVPEIVAETMTVLVDAVVAWYNNQYSWNSSA